MGTHISRVKSVDLDSWTDEQMQNMIRWGNARANKYWEAKLAEGHVPNESKIENFVRTKYDSKRWVMDGPMPDPSTLDDGAGGVADDDLPLNVVKEKAIERSGSLRNGGGAGIAPPPGQQRRAPAVDLFGDTTEQSVPARPSTTEPVGGRPSASKAAVAPPKQTKPGESLLGLDFLGGSAAPPARPSSTGPSTPGVPGRADLKSSILSLYASKPATAPQPQAQQQPAAFQSNADAFAGMSSPPLTSPTQSQTGTQQSFFGGMNDAFSSLSMTSSQPQQAQPKPSAFTNTSSTSTTHARQTSPKTTDLLSGGSFFDPKPVVAPPQPQPPKQISPPIVSQPITTTSRKESFGDSGFGDFSSASPVTSTKSPPADTSTMGDLFSMSASPPAQASKPATKPPAPAPAPVSKNPPPINYSAFNLSAQSAPPPQPASPPRQAAAPAISNFSNLSNMDAWGSNDAWATPDPPSQSQASTVPPIQTQTASTNVSSWSPVASRAPAPAPAMQTPFDSGWGDTGSSNKSAGGFSVQQDDDFGGWSHASPVATSATSSHAQKSSESGGGGGSGGGGRGFQAADDLFGNVWG